MTPRTRSADVSQMNTPMDEETHDLIGIPSTPGGTLIFIVAYEASRHIESVLERIPRAVLEDPLTHLLLIDDASNDGGILVARKWLDAHGIHNATLLRNPINQGYGGNQKLGYRLAVEANFDFVILLHGDGQYAPELLGEFVQRRRVEHADVVLGTRMSNVRSARRGGMKWYKVIGNKTLTAFQNACTGQKLSEYHTGYRGYSVDFLRKVPFESNTNDFHFDTEILLQAFHVHAKIAEFAIPTFYGDEICRVDGMKYAAAVIKATLQYKLHQLGMLCSLRYRDLTPARYVDKTQAAYSSHKLALEQLKKLHPKSVLDIGCGPGFVTKQCRTFADYVAACDYFPPADESIANTFKRVDLEHDELPFDIFDFDAVLLLDVIEHLKDPEGFLLDLRNRSAVRPLLDKSPAFVLSTPNIAFAAIRLNLLLGRFTYAERGILDITHKRLFTRNTLRRLLEDCGYDVVTIKPVPVPFETVFGGAIGKLFGWISNLLCQIWPTMFAFQFLVISRPKPGIRQLLRQAQRVTDLAEHEPARSPVSPELASNNSGTPVC